MRRLLRPILLPFLRRAPDEVERQARLFSVTSRDGLDLVGNVVRAFLGGYHAMLEARALAEVRGAGLSVEPQFRPFFFEGAAMGYLPRALFTDDAGRDRVEADLLGIDPRFLYLYYVGLGFWFGFRHPGRPGALESLAPHLDPFYLPLCYDGFGFKTGFFDHPKRAGARAILERAPANRRAEAYQGFGRALFFVCLEDESRFQREKSEVPAEHRSDVEAGRSLAVAFTGLRDPERILLHLAAARDDDERGLRLLGVTWALTAREMNDPEHFHRSIATLAPAQQALFRLLPQRCREAQRVATSYEDWRLRTKASAGEAYAVSEQVRRS